MPDAKLTALTELTTPAGVDLLYIVDDPSGTPLPRKVTVANLFANASPITIASGTITASTPALNVTQTWNNAGVTFHADTANITNTASAAASTVIRRQVGGSTVFSVARSGATTVTSQLIVSAGAFTDALAIYDSGGTKRIYTTGGATTLVLDAIFFTDSIDRLRLSTTLINMGATNELSWRSPFPADIKDLILVRDAANTLALRNSTNAQTLRTYGTYTDSSNYRRVAISMTTAGVASIAPEGAGTGASGNVLHISGLPTSNPGPGILWNSGGSVVVGT